jgi:hypothetical protein
MAQVSITTTEVPGITGAKGSRGGFGRIAERTYASKEGRRTIALPIGTYDDTIL